MPWISIAIIFLFIIDPIGSIQPLNELMEPYEKSRRRSMIIREALLGLVIILVFNVIGEGLFQLLSLSQTTVSASGAIILFLSGINILYPRQGKAPSLPDGEPFLVPIAVPWIARPALIATVMLFAHEEALWYKIPAMIVLSWAVASCILYYSKPIAKALGSNGITALERLMGLILVLLSMQRFLESIQLFIAEVNAQL